MKKSTNRPISPPAHIATPDLVGLHLFRAPHGLLRGPGYQLPGLPYLRRPRQPLHPLLPGGHGFPAGRDDLRPRLPRRLPGQRRERPAEQQDRPGRQPRRAAQLVHRAPRRGHQRSGLRQVLQDQPQAVEAADLRAQLEPVLGEQGARWQSTEHLGEVRFSLVAIFLSNYFFNFCICYL